LLTDSSSNFIQHCRAYFETQCRKKTAFVWSVAYSFYKNSSRCKVENQTSYDLWAGTLEDLRPL
jgi:hypothetical protein